MSDELGAAYFAVLIAAVIAWPLTLALLALYRRSVARLMQTRATAHRPLPSPSGMVRSPVAPVEASALPPPLTPEALELRINANIRRNVAVVAFGGILQAAALSTLFLALNELEILPVRWAVTTLYFVWPVIIGISIVGTWDRKRAILAATVYTVVLLVLGVAFDAGTLGPVLGPLGPLLVSASENALPSIVVAAYLRPSVRAVGTIVLGVVLAGLAGSLAVTGAVRNSETLLSFVVEVGLAANFDPIYVGLLAIGFLMTLPVGWLGSRIVGRLYANRQFSDQMVLLGSVWLVFSINYAVTLGPGDPAVFAAGLGTFAGLTLVVPGLYRLMRLQPAAPIRLLILRVFSQADHVLFDWVARRWRHLGTVRIIGGPDLATRTADPHKFLTFVSGGLRQLFISEEETLEARLASNSDRPDPDGRYRIDEFFCFDDAWRRAVDRLISSSEVVAMDLRGFTVANRGAADELELLATKGALHRTVFVVDDRTEVKLMEEILGHTTVGVRPVMIRVDRRSRGGDLVRACMKAASRSGGSGDPVEAHMG